MLKKTIILFVLLVAGALVTSAQTKWMILSPAMVPILMHSNISPQFAQIILRVGDSMTKGFTPLLASFAIYIGYINVYNLNKKKEFAEHSYIRSFASSTDDGTISDFVVAIESLGSKMIMYMAGEIKVEK